MFFFLFLRFKETKPRKKLPDEALDFQYIISHFHLEVIEREKLIREQSHVK